MTNHLKKAALALLLPALLGGVAAAQASILTIPALPLHGTVSSVTTTPSTPDATTSTPASDLPTVTTLPTAADAVAGEYTVSLDGPTTVQAGEATTWSFNLTNTGSDEIKLQHGACDVRFEVINAAGEVVRPDPKNAICTMQLVYFEAQNGETQEVQKIRWDGKDGSGNPVPAGEYIIRAKYVGGGQFTPAATLNITVQ